MIEHGAWRDALLARLFAVSATAGFVVLVPSVIAAVHFDVWIVAAGDLGAFGLLLILLKARRLGYPVRAAAFSAMFFALSIVLFIGIGPYIAAPTWLFVSIAFAAMLLGHRGAIGFGIATVVMCAALVLLLELGVLPWTISSFSFAVQLLSVLAAALCIILAARAIIARLDESFALQKRMYESLRRHADRQEQLVQELHHRVKNNLQLLDSLMSLEIRTIDSPKREHSGTPPISDTLSLYHGRLRVLAVVHDETYPGESSPSTSMAGVFRAVWHRAWARFAEGRTPPRCTVSCTDQEVPVEAATALALFTHDVWHKLASLASSASVLPAATVDFAGTAASVPLSITITWSSPPLEQLADTIGPEPSSILAALSAQLGCRLNVDAADGCLYLALQRVTRAPGAVRRSGIVDAV